MSEVKKPSIEDIERFRRAYTIDEARMTLDDITYDKNVPLTHEERDALLAAKRVLWRLRPEIMDHASFLWFVAESAQHPEYLEPRYRTCTCVLTDEEQA